MKHFMFAAASSLLLSGCVSQAQRAQDQADMNASVPQCTTKKQCDVEWQAAAVWVTQHCGMKIQTNTDALIQTFNSPPDSPSTSCTVTKIQGPGSTAALTIHVGCNNIFGCVPDRKDSVIAFGEAIKQAGAPFQPLHIGVIWGPVDSHGRPTMVLAESTGMLVKTVENGSRAQMAGIRPDDVVVGLNEKRVRTLDDWIAEMEQHGPGDVVSVKIRRAGQDELLKMPL